MLCLPMCWGLLSLRQFPKKDTTGWLEAAVGTSWGRSGACAFRSGWHSGSRVPAERPAGFQSDIRCEHTYKLWCEEHSLNVIACVFRNSTVIGILLLHQRKG